MTQASNAPAILFDAYGTLFDVYSVGALADSYFPGRGQELATIWRTKQLEYTWLRTLSGRYKRFWELTNDALGYAAARLNLEFAVGQREALMQQYAKLTAFPENLEVLRQLRALGCELGILTNGNLEMVQQAIESAGMSELLQHVLSADTVQQYKTTDAVYRLGEQALGKDAAQIVFVSSNCWDACAARWFGYRSFWVNRQGLPLDALDVEPVAQGSNLDDLLKWVRHDKR
jgi:2-haloacid dehalogenase